MRKLIAVENLSLDGIMQAPGRPDEDRCGGFEYGGWATGYRDEVMAAEMAAGIANAGPLLLGRRTYEDFYAVWPARKESPFSEILNRLQKYVASRTLREPLPWQNSTLLSGDAAETVARLKREPGKDITVLGSGDLMQTLIQRGLVDEYVLSIHPLVLGHGKRLFTDGGYHASLKLTRSVPTTTGVIIARYQPS